MQLSTSEKSDNTWTKGRWIPVTDTSTSFNTSDASEKRSEHSTIYACPGPLFDKGYNPAHVVAYIEYYKFIGVTHFVIYNTSPREDVSYTLELADSRYFQLSAILNYYRDQGTVTVVDYALPPASQLRSRADYHYYAQQTLLKDCHLRIRFVFLKFENLLFTLKA